MNLPADPRVGDPAAPLDETDADVLVHVREMYALCDPPPPDLVDRIRFALQLETIEMELATVSDSPAELVTRASEEARTITFDSESLTVMVTVTPSDDGTVRLDGWLAPPASLRVELLAGAARRRTQADTGGRFVLDGVEQGQVRLAIHPTPESEIELARTVLTPYIVL